VTELTLLIHAADTETW